MIKPLRLCFLIAFAVLLGGQSAAAQSALQLKFLGRYETGVFAEGASEIVAHDPISQRYFVVNGDAHTVDVLDASDVDAPTLLFQIDIAPYGKGANSVAVSNGVVAAAVENNDKQADGRVVFFDADGNYLNDLPAGALPDMITFTPDGKTVLVANEGEPNDDYTVDPEGSVTMIRMRRKVEKMSERDVTQINFRKFNGAQLDPSVRVFGPGATAAQDFEPEYIAVSPDSKTAWVVLQENNAMARINLRNGKIESLTGLGFKDHSVAGNELDASNRDDAINIRNWPVFGMYLPDGIAAYEASAPRGRGRGHHGCDWDAERDNGYGRDHDPRHRRDDYRKREDCFGGVFIVSANEGDSRDYDGFSEEERIGDLALDPDVFPNAAELQANANLGRLKTTSTRGDVDGDGLYEELYSYGARSFSIWSADGELVYDSGDLIEQITAAAFPDDFNSDNEENDSFDDRSDDKGPEPEGVAIGTIGSRTYAFIGLERMGGVAVFDVTSPTDVSFEHYINTRDFGGDPEASTAGDLGPEGLIFIDAKDSPTRRPLLVVAYEISGTTTVYEVDTARAPHWKLTAQESLALERQASASLDFVLSPAYPNPASDKSTVEYQLPRSVDVSLKVYDVMGREVSVLAEGRRDAGTYSVVWDGTDKTGKRVANGTYFYRLETDGLIQTRSQVIAR